MNRFIRGLVASVIMSLGGCSSGSGESTTATTGTGMSAKVASFDLVAERPQRFQVGLVDDANQSVLTGGAVGLSFRFMGRAEQSVKLPPSSSAEARFVPLAGQPDRPREQQPAFSSGATGVYRTDPVMFTDYGLWEVGVTAATTSGVKRATAFFKVEASSPLPRPGYRAPSTVNPLPGASGVSLTSIDSRADTTSNAVPDPELHSVTIAAALAARRPLIVVVSTPTFCESRFCGPITDSVAELARTDRSGVVFVHLEVWLKYDASELNPAAQEWIDPNKTHEGNEPWVFVVNRDGVIVDRFDNVASDADLRVAIAQVSS